MKEKFINKFFSINHFSYIIFLFILLKGNLNLNSQFRVIYIYENKYYIISNEKLYFI